MRVVINLKSGKAVYLQIVDQIKAAIASGSLRRGELLPSIRPLAEDLRINRNTVAKAYTELERQGVVEAEAGRGVFVAAVESPFRKDARLRLLTKEVDDAVVQAHHLRIARTDFLRLVQERFEVFEQLRSKASNE